MFDHKIALEAHLLQKGCKQKWLSDGLNMHIPILQAAGLCVLL